MFVAAVSSLPILFLSDVRAQEFTGDVPALIIGVIGYLFGAPGREVALDGDLLRVTALALGVLVAAVKSVLAAH